jgi:glycosyltransferase involved in cell wall biosynthesis
VGPLKLALVTPGGFGPGGRKHVIPALVDLAGELARRHEVHVFAFGGSGGVTRHELYGAQIHQLGDPTRLDPPSPPQRARTLVRLAQQLWRELRAAGRGRRFDLFHGFWAAEPGLFAIAAARFQRVPVAVSLGGGEAIWIPEIGYGGAGSRFGQALTAAVFRGAATLTVGSAFARSFLPAAAQARTEIVPLGADVARFEAPVERSPGPPWRLVHVGSINRVKDHRTLLDAFAALRQQLGDVTLDCVGEDTLAGEMQAYARTLPPAVSDAVRFHGFLEREALAALYRGAHLLLLSSRYESQSVAVLEAAAAGVPTVGTAVGLLPTLAPEAAQTVRVGDAQGLAAAAREVLTDEALRRQIGRAAQAFARQHDVRATAAAFERMYSALISG